MFEDILGSVNSARNSVQNALGVTNNSAGLGSFRGVSFYTFREQRQTGGRRIVKREYLLRDEGGAIDLGRKLTERTFTACLLGKMPRRNATRCLKPSTPPARAN